jgi:hypothetical protein
LSDDYDDWPAVVRNMAKARQRWAYISRILRREGATPRILAMFYKAVVQTVLLFGSASWVLTPSMLGKLEGFHRQIARWLMGRAPVYLRSEGTWQYQPLGNAMEEAGLYSIVGHDSYYLIHISPDLHVLSFFEITKDTTVFSSGGHYH